MKDSRNECSSYEELSSIAGISFTHREIDVISCIVCQRATKKIAAILTITPNTVLTHNRKIMSKLSCNSRDGIIDFIERSGKVLHFKKNYESLLIRPAFTDILKQISKIDSAGIKKLHIIITKEKITESEEILRSDIQASLVMRNLEDIGYNVSLEELEWHGAQSQVLFEPEGHLRRIHFLPRSFLDASHDRESILNSHQEKIRHNPKTIFILSDRKEAYPESIILPIENRVHELRDGLSYYLDFLSLLQHLRPEISLDQTIKKFRESIGLEDVPFRDETEAEYLPPQSEMGREVGIRGLSPIQWATTALRANKFIALISLFTILCILTWILIPTHQYDKTQSAQPSRNLTTIRSELSVPPTAKYLDRVDITEKIDASYGNGTAELETVALIGTGGAGKTTIARNYALVQPLPVVWELNSETQGSLEEGYEKLAHALAETNKDKELLKVLVEIKDREPKTKKLIEFVSERLRNKKNWLLIFDNMEDPAVLSSLLFPKDSYMWGRGRILVTTRNKTFQHSSNIKRSINIRELNLTQKVELFSKIMDDGKSDAGNEENASVTTRFLEQLPPYPLDIITAAYYLKSTKISYETYIEHMNQGKESFTSLQGQILSGVGDYEKTRFGIMAVSLKDLTKINPDFIGLIYMLSMLDSQDIPRSLLTYYADNQTVDAFIYNATGRFSLLNPETVSYCSSPSVSLHRSTQELARTFLEKNLALTEKQELMSNIVKALSRHIQFLIETENFCEMRNMSRHCETLLRQCPLLTPEMISVINTELGGMYYYLGHYGRAKDLLEGSLNYSRKLGKAHHEAKTLSYLGIVYRNLGDYSKATEVLERSVLLYEKDAEQAGSSLLALTHLGYVYKEVGNWQQTINILEKNLQTNEKYFKDHLSEKARLQVDLGNAYRSNGDYDRAKTILEESVDIYERSPKKDKFRQAWAMAHLANVHRSFGNYQQAKQLLDKSYEMCLQFSPDNHVGLNWILARQGISYKEIGLYDQSRKILEKSLQSHILIDGKESVRTAWVMAHLASVQAKQGYMDSAKEMVDRAVEIHKNKHGNDSIRTAWVLIQQGTVYEQLGYYEQALTMLGEAQKIYSNYYEANHLKMLTIKHRIGRANIGRGQYKKAATELNTVYQAYLQHYGAHNLETAEVMLDIGYLYFLEGRLRDAEQILNKCLNILIDQDHPDSHICLERLAELYTEMSLQAYKSGDNEQYLSSKMMAAEALARAFSIVKIHFKPDSAHYARAESLLLKMQKPKS